MRRPFYCCLVAASAVAAGTSSEKEYRRVLDDDDPNVQITSLKTEYLVNPLGVDKEIPRVSWKILVDKESSDHHSTRTRKRLSFTFTKRPRNVSQRAYQLHVKVTPSTHVSSSQCDGSWIDCGWVDSVQTHLVPFQCEGVTPLLQSDTDIAWSVSVRLDSDGENVVVDASEVAYFRTGIRTPSWVGQWITGGTLLRKEFSLQGNAAEYATLFVSGIGYHHVYLNGDKVGDHQLDPGWTDYEKRVWYSSYNVTEMLNKEEKTVSPGAASASSSNYIISVMMGNGWWSCGPTPGTNQPGCSDDPPQVILQLNVNGHPVLWSNETWSVSDASPVLYNSLYNGETYDARIEERIEGWMLPAFLASSTDWKAASLADTVASKAKLASQLFEPIRHVSATSPVSIHIKSNIEGEMIQVVDFGQNQAAVVRLKRIVCPRGQTIIMRHAEILMHPPYGDFDNATIYTTNLRAAKATDRYICKGDPNGESYTPLFTQHGFRYVEMAGLSYELDFDDLETLEIHTDVRQTSFIEFGEPLLNRIQHMVMWGLKSNFMSVQTDCNQRDERRGWMGDAALTAEAASLSFGMGAFYTHWLEQIAESQNPNDGSMPDFVPALGRTKPGAPNWQTAYAMILWVMVSHYGDRDIVAIHHDTLVRYFDFWEDNYLRTGLAHFRTGFGDWVPPPPHKKAHGPLMSAFAFFQNLKIGIELFGQSNHSGAAAQTNRLTRLLQKAMPEYHQAFYNNSTGAYMSGKQTEQALSLYSKAVPDDLVPSVLSQLVEDIQVTNVGHTTSGIVGIKIAMEVLSELGRGDVALDLALEKSYPSWGYMTENPLEPATTVWELWNSDVAGPGMNSRNHHMFGSITSWFYKYVAGITPIEPGFSRLQIRPNVLRLDKLAANVVSPYGDISLIYSRQEGANGGVIFVYEITLPPGSTGVFQVPIAMNDRPHRFVSSPNPSAESILDFSIFENREPVWLNWQFIPGSTHGVVRAQRIGNHVQLELPNGSFQFEVRVSARNRTAAQTTQ